MDIDAAYATFLAAGFVACAKGYTVEEAMKGAHRDALAMLDNYIEFKKQDERRYIDKLHAE